MGKLRQYSSQQPIATGGDTRMLRASDFGDPGVSTQAAGQQIAAFGDKIMQAAGRKAAREDGLERVRIVEDFEAKVAAEKQRIRQEGGYGGHPGMGPSMYASKETKVGFGEYLQSEIQTAMETANLQLPESQARLMEALEKSRGLHARAVAEDINIEQRKLRTQHLTRQFSVIADDSVVTGDMDNARELVRQRVNDFADSYTDAEEKEEIRRGDELIMTSHLQDALMQFDDEKAMEIVNHPDFVPTVGIDRARELRMKALAQHMEKEKGRLAGEQALAKTAAILEIPVSELSERDRRITAGLESIQTRTTLAQKMAEVDALVAANPERADEIRRLAGMDRKESNIELRLRLWEERNPGKEMPDDVYNKIINADIGGEEATLKERRLGFLLENADAFAAKSLAPQDEAKFVAMAQALQNEGTMFRTDPTTRQILKTTNPLPPFLRAALDNRPDVELQAIGIDEASREGGDIEMPPLEQVTGNQTVFGTMTDAVGPVSFTKAKLEDIAFIGELVQGQKNIEAQRRIAMSNRLLIAALVNNDRFPVKEMEAVQREFGMDPGAFQSVSGFLSRMVVVNENLSTRKAEQYAYLASTGKKTPRNIANANRIIRDIEQYQKILGLPDVYDAAEFTGDSFDPNDYDPGELILIRSPEGEYVQAIPNPISDKSTKPKDGVTPGPMR